MRMLSRWERLIIPWERLNIIEKDWLLALISQAGDLLGYSEDDSPIVTAIKQRWQWIFYICWWNDDVCLDTKITRKAGWTLFYLCLLKLKLRRFPDTLISQQGFYYNQSSRLEITFIIILGFNLKTFFHIWLDPNCWCQTQEIWHSLGSIHLIEEDLI